jgi:NAD(P)-dependent dehydrogenase (short-subunit alcohol dehydrogenase family)
VGYKPDARRPASFRRPHRPCSGASRGIGRAAAVALAHAGAQVVATATNQGALEELDDEVRTATGRSLTLVPLDLKDGDGLDRLGAAIHERWGRLDALVAAAAVLGPMSPLSHVEPKDWAKVMAVNLTANWRLLRSVDPLLRASDAGRAVFLTSRVAAEPGPIGAPTPYPRRGWRRWSGPTPTRRRPRPVRVAIYDPGRTRTRMRAKPSRARTPPPSPAASRTRPRSWSCSDLTSKPPRTVVRASPPHAGLIPTATLR